MRGLEELRAHLDGRLKLKTTSIEIVPPRIDDTKADHSGDQVPAKLKDRNDDQRGN